MDPRRKPHRDQQEARRVRRKPLMLGALIAVVAVLAYLSWDYHHFRQPLLELHTAGKCTSGLIVGIKYTGGNGRRPGAQYAIYEYEVETDGGTGVFSRVSSRIIQPHEIGRECVVVYLPGRPQESRIAMSVPAPHPIPNIEACQAAKTELQNRPWID